MILKATIKCSCGCSYEMVSCKNHELAKCPNCSKVFSESEKLVNILKIFNSINLTEEKSDSDLGFDHIFHHESLTINTIESLFTVSYERDNE